MSLLPVDVAAKINAELEAANAQIVARNGSMEWTRGELEALFGRVQPAGNWKLAIDAVTVAANDRELLGLREAVIFFAGCVPTLTPLGGNRYRVRAVGYYAAVGA